MQKKLRLSKRRHGLVTEYLPLATMLAKFFVQSRPPWQRSALFPDLEAEGFLALTEAARTYDRKKLPWEPVTNPTHALGTSIIDKNIVPRSR